MLDYQTFQESLAISARYVETALARRSFSPAEPPQEALKYVQDVFLESLKERTVLPENLTSVLSHNIYVVALRYLYVFVPGKETPLSFVAAVRFLNLLGQESDPMSDAEWKLGKTVLETLQVLQDPEDAIVSEIHARLGVHLNS